MNNKIKNYVEEVFSGIPRSKKANDLKEEFLSNMSERFDDYLKAGKTENQAFGLVITSLGDIDEMLADVMPSDEFVKEANQFRDRNAKYIAVSVTLYIIGGAFLIGSIGLGVFLDNIKIYVMVGLICLLVISALATGLIIYSQMSTPLEYKDYNKESKEIAETMDSKHTILLNNTLTVYWIIIAAIYLVISFITMLWPITWIIFVIASVFHFILKTFFENKYGYK